MYNFFVLLFNSAVYVCFLGLVAGFFFAVIPKKVFYRLSPLFKERRYEKGGIFYNKYFKINQWKDKLPQFSELTRFGFKKASLNNISDEYLEIFKTETMRAELTHFVLIILSPLYVFVKPDILHILTLTGCILGNIPFIMIQRYNRIRIIKLQSRLKNHIRNSKI